MRYLILGCLLTVGCCKTAAPDTNAAPTVILDSENALYYTDDPSAGVRCYRTRYSSVTSCVQIKEPPEVKRGR